MPMISKFIAVTIVIKIAINFEIIGIKNSSFLYNNTISYCIYQAKCKNFIKMLKIISVFLTLIFFCGYVKISDWNLILRG